MGRRLRAMHRAVMSAAEGGFYIQTKIYRLKQKAAYTGAQAKREGYQNEESGSY